MTKRPRPSVKALAEQLKEERRARATLVARERDDRTHFLRTITELRWAIHDLLVHFEQHKGGYTHAELSRVDEIRKMQPGGREAELVAKTTRVVI